MKDLTLVADLDVAIALCRAFDVCVQAGGNVGVWPKRLAQRFATVYTFEPEAMSFAQLVARTREQDNIIKFQAALGYARGCVGLSYDRCGLWMNTGAVRVEGTGNIPVVRIDDLALARCDLIQLDVEGYEPFVLQGAMDTIARHKPVVMVEDKGLSEQYGTPPGWSERALSEVGYRVAARVHRDVILVCDV